jgi:4-methylaminobutanoate oxidase (formaldehyde-forming)
LESQRNQPRTKRLIQFRLHDPDRLLYHDEPIYRDGDLVGRTSSGMWSYVAGSALAMGYVNCADGVTKEWLEAGEWQIEVATTKIDATPSIRSFYDPANQRVRM